ncbi:MAG TPA: FecR domain-containing protein [Polyangiaceae bacterium]
MSATHCPRLFEAEAMRDGRLSGAERASFERHLTTCSTCLREVESLEGLAESLRASSPDDADELRVRRERTRLLAAFDRVLVAPEGQRAARRLLWAAPVVALVVGVVVWRVRSGAQPSQASKAVVHPDDLAVWSEHMDAGGEKVVLERGALWIHVEHSSGDGRLLVVLPDGELEDTGTTFAVRVENGRTTRVTVEEGHVVLRLRGRSPVLVGPGDSWVASVPAPAACASATSPSESAPTERLAPLPSAPRLPPSAPVGSTLAPDPSVDFRAAMDSLDVGDNHEAATKFASFLESHPRDPRAEDAAYLRVIALQRSGDTSRMREAALAYLRLYPAGFRHAEVQPLAR